MKKSTEKINLESGDKIKALYLDYEVLSGSTSGGEKAYLSILSSAKGSHKEKILVAQFIPRFFHRFPDMYEEVFNAYLDLCEDENISVRKEAIKGFPKFFQGENKDNNSFYKRFGDILCQMLGAEEQSEASLVRDSLTALLKSNPGPTLHGIFLQVVNGDDAVRSLALKFLGNRVRKLNSSWNKEVLDILLNQVKECLKECLAEEIPIMFGLLLSTALGKNLGGRKQVLAAVLSILQEDDVRLPVFLRHATALISISPELASDEFFNFLIRILNKGTSLKLLKLLAQLTSYTRHLQDVDQILDKIYTLLLEFLPPPDTYRLVQTLSKFEFLTVECLLSILHQLLKASPNYFSNKIETLRDFRYRLLYFTKACGAFSHVIEETIRNNSKEVDKIKLLSLKTLNNISILIKDFFHNPPKPVASITLSWLAVDRNSPCKRKSNNIEFEKNEKVQKVESEERQYTYKPPIGKYSQNLKCF